MDWAAAVILSMELSTEGTSSSPSGLVITGDGSAAATSTSWTLKDDTVEVISGRLAEATVDGRASKPVDAESNAEEAAGTIGEAVTAGKEVDGATVELTFSFYFLFTRCLATRIRLPAAFSSLGFERAGVLTGGEKIELDEGGERQEER